MLILEMAKFACVLFAGIQIGLIVEGSGREQHHWTSAVVWLLIWVALHALSVALR